MDYRLFKSCTIWLICSIIGIGIAIFITFFVVDKILYKIEEILYIKEECEMVVTDCKYNASERNYIIELSNIDNSDETKYIVNRNSIEGLSINKGNKIKVIKSIDKTDKSLSYMYIPDK